VGVATPGRTRIYTDESGRTRGAEESIDLAVTDFAPPTPHFLVSDPVIASQVRFGVLPVGWVGDWHPTPRRQYLVQLAGEHEIELRDGRRYRIEPGRLLLLEDVDGGGHRSRVVGDQPLLVAFVQLP
jgi:hypothetical protein